MEHNKDIKSKSLSGMGLGQAGQESIKAAQEISKSLSRMGLGQAGLESIEAAQEISKSLSRMGLGQAGQESINAAQEISKSLSGMGLGQAAQEISKSLSGMGLGQVAQEISKSLSGMGLGQAAQEISKSLSRMGLGQAGQESINAAQEISKWFSGIAGLGSMKESWYTEFNSIDFSKIKVDENGIIDYFDEAIKIEDVIEDVSSLLSKENSTEEEKEQSIESLGNLNKLIQITVYIFFMLLFINLQFADCSEHKGTNLGEHCNENIEEFKENIHQGLDNMATTILSMYMLLNAGINKIDAFTLKHPFTSNVTTNAIGGVICQLIRTIYKRVKKKKESLSFAKEILNDSNRRIKFIIKQVNESIKNETDNEIVNNLFYSSFRLVSCNSLYVRTSCSLMSPVLYKLSLGEIVVVVDKKRNWTRIRFDGQDNCSYIGWVLTRYLKRFE